MTELTEHLKKVLVALVAYKRQNDEMPTIKELTESCGFGSQTATTDAMKRLRDQGYITLIPRKSRGIIINRSGYKHGKDTDSN